MKFEKEIKSSALILRISGDFIEEYEGFPLMKSSDEAIAEKIKICILDISSLRYINSLGIGSFIAILTKFRNKGGEVYLMNPLERVKKLLAITKLNSIFQVVQTEEEALDLYSKIG